MTVFSQPAAQIQYPTAKGAMQEMGREGAKAFLPRQLFQINAIEPDLAPVPPLCPLGKTRLRRHRL